MTVIEILNIKIKKKTRRTKQKVKSIKHQSRGQTEWQFKADVEQQPVEGRVFGSTDLILSHDHVGVQRQPLTWTLLGIKVEKERDRDNK